MRVKQEHWEKMAELVGRENYTADAKFKVVDDDEWKAIMEETIDDGRHFEWFTIMVVNPATCKHMVRYAIVTFE